MKRVLYIVLGFVGLFAVAWTIYQANLESAQESSVQIAIEESEESLVSDESSSQISSENSIELSEASEESFNEEGSQEVEESESRIIWRGPSTTYLDENDQVIRLLENSGKPTLINIWASWCLPCRDEMPEFESAYQQFGDQVNFVMLNALESRPSETKEAALEFAESINLSMPIYFDNEFSNQIEFSANMLPLTALLSEDGEIIEVVRGQVSPAKLKQLMGKAGMEI